jgi:NAD(P)-dependent dehydrogenase (short-subunit alcohol dehydrogenase family)
MSNKTAIITGGAGLLGPQHALALNEIGFDVVILDISKKRLKTQKKYFEINKINKKNNIYCYYCDITSEQSVKNILLKLTKKNIKINVLINNADCNPKMKNLNNKNNGGIENYSISKLKSEINVGIVGTFICCKIFGSSMTKNGSGVIINVSSDLGINAPDQRVYHPKENMDKVKNFKPIGYSISKHAILGITKYVATYWAHKNIRCNTLVPGAVFNSQPNFLVNNVKKRIPLSRWARKEEYKKAIQFLATDDSSYMTGQSLIIDGGRSTW